MVRSGACRARIPHISARRPDVDHFWQTIPGYFTFPDFYHWVAEQAGRGDWHGVEVGVYTGQSAAFLGVEIVNRWATDIRQPAARLDLVDLELTKHRARQNLAPLERSEVLGRFLEMSSVAASYLYEDRSLDFVFIDADHSYAAVAQDIDAWRPKVRSGGILAGHDFCDWPGFGVMQAVNERFARFEVWPGSKGMGDAQMQPRQWPVWCVRL